MKQRTSRSDEAIRTQIGDEIETFDKETGDMEHEMEAVEA